MTAYQDRVNAEWLAAQAAPVQKTAKAILDTLHNAERYVYWALDPEETYPDSWATRLIEAAHALIDEAHAYKAALAANPPPKIPEENPEEDLTNTR